LDAKGCVVSASDAFHIYDTTLRDGAQQEGLNLSVHDKLTIARHLDDLGVGFIEGGWKDTVLVMPGESVKIIKPFQDFKGLFMYHCHNLEHEDMGMMRDFSVE
jgi:isopropylmalate/homocitrate/citramalate synthase